MVLQKYLCLSSYSCGRRTNSSGGGGRVMAWLCIAAALLILSSSSAAAASAKPQANETALQFTYTGDMGPNNWAKLSPKFSLCGNGKAQSPINIVTGEAVLNKNLKPLLRPYRIPVNATLVDYKYTVGIEYPNHTGGIIVNGKSYALKQMHWHSPSEHRINGKRYAAEMHVVHVAPDDGSVLVVGTLFKYGQPDPVLGTVHRKLNYMASEVRSHETAGPMTVEAFHPTELTKTALKYYKYTGSSSVPPCTENLIYLILAEPRSISKEQVEAIKGTLDVRCKNNARPCQPINGRHMEVFDEELISRG